MKAKSLKIVRLLCIICTSGVLAFLVAFIAALFRIVPEQASFVSLPFLGAGFACLLDRGIPPVV